MFVSIRLHPKNYGSIAETTLHHVGSSETRGEREGGQCVFNGVLHGNPGNQDVAVT